jgi:tetratricopeptide (TPR) repeat protein
LLGLGVLCLRQGLRDESERALLRLKGTPQEAQARRYLVEMGRDFPAEASAIPPPKEQVRAPDPQPLPPDPVKIAEPAPPVERALFSRYVAARREFAVALQRRELDVAARALLKPARDERLAGPVLVSALEGAAPKLTTAPGDAAVRRLFDAAEEWLAKRAEKNELDLRCAFDARDLAAVALAHGEVEAAVDRLVTAGTEVTLSVDGELRSGPLRLSRGQLTLFEKVVQGGQAGEVGWAISTRVGKGARLPIASLAAIVQADRAKRAVRPDRVGALCDALLAAYDAYPARSVAPLVAMRAVEASGTPAERARMRVEEYAELQATLGAWPADMLAMASEAEAHVKRARTRLAAGDAQTAADAFEQAQHAYDAMAKSLDAGRPEPSTDEWRHAAMQAAYHRAMCRAARLDSLWGGGRRDDAETQALFAEFARMLSDFMWEYEPYASSHDAMLVLVQVTARLAERSEPAQAWPLWEGAFKALARLRSALVDPKLRASETVRALAARTALAEARVLMAYADGGSRRAHPRYAEAARVVEEFFKAYPAARAQEPELVLELGRAWCEAGQVDRGLPLVESVSRDARCSERATELLIEFARDPKAALAAGELLLERGGDRFYRAVAAFRRGLEADRARGWHGIGMAYYGLGRWFEASTAFGEAQKAGHPDGAVRRTMALRRTGQEDGAKSAREKELDAGDAARRSAWEAPRRGSDSVAMVATSGPPLSDRMPAKTPALDRATWRKAVLSRGGSRETEEAVLNALTWLARHQNADGSWSATRFVDRCNRHPRYGAGGACTPNPGRADFDAGVTGLALLAFLGAGYSHHSEDVHEGIRFGDVVRRGLQGLLKQQDREGCVGPRSTIKYMLNHALCATALAEAYGTTGSILLQEPAQRAVDFVIAAQNPGKGWRYSFKCGDNDTLATALAVGALYAAELSGLLFPRTGYDGTRSWLDEVTEENYYRVGYTHKGTGEVYHAEDGTTYAAMPRPDGRTEWPGNPMNVQFSHHEAMTAAAVTVRIRMDRARNDSRLSGGCQLLVKDLPYWKDTEIDFLYWHFGSAAVLAYDGPSGAYCKQWNERVKGELVSNQNTKSTGCKSGSWETVDRWSLEGGRVYATAINALTLETYYRYPIAVK